jgi:eukaryotic-like serine/threonine-protein kinase
VGMEAGPPPLPPRYADPRLIGRGGMADVYAAKDTRLGRVVAVKVLAARYARDDDVRRRFRREALVAARLSDHPHVVTIYDVGEAGGRPHIVMEHAAGGTVSRAARGRRITWAEALRWLEGAASALDLAHARGVVHRDVTPGNLLLDERGIVKVADFGIAKVLDTLSASATATGTILGTAGYLAPEVAGGEPATGASDRYALGVVAYELLTGGRPFAGRGTAGEMAARLYEEPPPASSREPFLPPEVDAVLARALDLDPDRRQPSARALVDELRAALEPTAATPVGAPPAPDEPRRGRRRWPIAVAAGVAAAVVAALVAVVVSAGGGEGPAVTTVARAPAGSAATPAATAPASATTAPAPRPPPAPPAASVAQAKALNDDAYALMQRGRWRAALPLLERAVPALRGIGPGDPYEAYADYNLGRTLLALGRCREALVPLHRSDALQDRVELDRALAAATRCAGSR